MDQNEHRRRLKAMQMRNDAEASRERGDTEWSNFSLHRHLSVKHHKSIDPRTPYNEMQAIHREIQH